MHSRRSRTFPGHLPSGPIKLEMARAGSPRMVPCRGRQLLPAQSRLPRKLDSISILIFRSKSHPMKPGAESSASRERKPSEISPSCLRPQVVPSERREKHLANPSETGLRPVNSGRSHRLQCQHVFTQCLQWRSKAAPRLRFAVHRYCENFVNAMGEGWKNRHRCCSAAWRSPEGELGGRGIVESRGLADDVLCARICTWRKEAGEALESTPMCTMHWPSMQSCALRKVGRRTKRDAEVRSRTGASALGQPTCSHRGGAEQGLARKSSAVRGSKEARIEAALQPAEVWPPSCYMSVQQLHKTTENYVYSLRTELSNQCRRTAR